MFFFGGFFFCCDYFWVELDEFNENGSSLIVLIFYLVFFIELGVLAGIGMELWGFVRNLNIFERYFRIIQNNALRQ
jgi:hypothetical protein